MARYINKYDTLADYEDASSEVISTGYDVANTSLIDSTRAKKYDHKIMLGQGSVLASLNQSNNKFKPNTWLADTNVAISSKLKGHKGFGSNLLSTVTTVEGVLTEMNANEIMHYEYRDKNITSITIPEGVTHIYTGAFNGCENLTEVKLPSTLQYTGKHAFDSCTSLTHIVIPANVSVIDTHAFAYCSSLEVVTFASNIGTLTIGNGAFRACRSLEAISLPDTVKTLNKNVFRDCSALKYFRIGSGLRYVLAGAFRGCSSLERMDINPNNPCFRTENGVTIMTTFNDGEDLGNNRINRVIHVNTALTEVVIPQVTSIHYNVFRNCPNLERITCLGINAPYKRCFAGCANLESVVIYVRSFSQMKNAFVNCPNLRDLTVIPLNTYNINGDFGGEYHYAFSIDNKESPFGTIGSDGYEDDYLDAISNIDLHVPSEYVDDFSDLDFNSVTAI